MCAVIPHYSSPFLIPHSSGSQVLVFLMFLCTTLNNDVSTLAEEVYGGIDADMRPSVIKDLVDQVNDLKKRFTTIMNLSDDAPPLEAVEVNHGSEPFVCTVSEFFQKARRKLLMKKDLVQDWKRYQENMAKTILQETLKIFPKAKLVPLENRRVFYPWSNQYSAVKKTLKDSGVPE